MGIDRVCSIQDQVFEFLLFASKNIPLPNKHYIDLNRQTHSNSIETKMDTGFDELSLYSPRNNTNLSKFTPFRGPSTIMIIIITREPLKSQKALLL